MKDYLIWLNGGNSLGGTAEENELIKLKENYKKAESGKQADNYVCYELKDTDGVTYVNLFNIQAIAITECTGNKDIGFSPYKSAREAEIYYGPQINTNKCVREFAKRLKDALETTRINN
ncbi:MAG: hypothetical protein LKE46_01810 [Clostridium sp.]|uniref:hypothetical protein n=1 Tax=Clostridium sp. TaxID=1506 RepID=UPI0025C4F52F|nr:hypothetical protein [Clostridium sp.]MCH3962986.1 hypothetical protein [Clostridium sp.]MCI1800195.1 hypothetical protein [Clostridium sp.]MCI2202065.1 hypothetical protein [Clostridium sp.]